MFNSLDAIEKNAFERTSLDLSNKMEKLHNSFDSKVAAKEGYYAPEFSAVKDNWTSWLDLKDSSKLGEITGENVDTIKRMYYGSDSEGIKTLGLEDISHWKLNPEYRQQNVEQQSGYVAEVISTAKENIIAQKEGTGITTYRADDRPDLYHKNDQYVDKVRIDADGKIVDRVQTKFVGNDGRSCLQKLESKDFDKYFSDGKVDKMEIPSDYYDQIKEEKLIEKKIEGLEKQVERLKVDGKSDIAANKQARIDKLKKIDEMLERSTVSSDEAKYARLHPKRYTRKLFVPDNVKMAHEMGKETGLQAAGITAVSSTVDNIRSVYSGDKTIAKACEDVAADTGKAGALGYGTGFVSSAIANAMSGSSHELLKSVSKTGIPAAAVSFTMESFDSVSDFAQGTIDGKQLAVDLGENAAGISGNMAGSAIGSTVGAATGAAAGGVVGSVVAPGVGTAAGMTIGGKVGGAVGGIAGGMIGYAVTTQAYRTAVVYEPEQAVELADKAKGYATETIESVKQFSPDKVEIVKDSINAFASANSLPFQL